LLGVTRRTLRREKTSNACHCIDVEARTTRTEPLDETQQRKPNRNRTAMAERLTQWNQAAQNDRGFLIA
jgi:hypothetical protein